MELIEQLKQQLAAPLFTAVSSQLESYQNRLQYAELKTRVLEERLRLIRIAKYGPGSEKLADAQLELLELEPSVRNLEVEQTASGKGSHHLAKARLASIRVVRNCPPIFASSKFWPVGRSRVYAPVAVKKR